MRGLVWIAAACLVGSQAACDQVDEWRANRGDAGRLSLSLEAPATLDWGETGTIRVGLQNQGGSATDGATVEVYLPPWLDFGSVEPVGTEVTLLAGADGTRLSYRVSGPLQPGERREIVQHVRVPDAGSASESAASDTATGDTAGVTRPPPTNRMMRARLVNASGDVIGGEVRAVLSFRGAQDAPRPQPSAGILSDSVIRDDRVGGVRLGMTVEELRREVADARDTTVALPDGGREQAVLLPIGDDRSIAAVVSPRGVEQIMVRDTGFSTERGLGVGSRLGALRSVYGEECAERFARGRVAVRFATAPGVAFVVSATAPSDTARLDDDTSWLPDSARVTELWVRNRRDPC